VVGGVEEWLCGERKNCIGHVVIYIRLVGGVKVTPILEANGWNTKKTRDRS